MIRDIIQLQKFNVSQGSCFEQSWDRLNRRPGAGADNDVFSTQDTGFPVRQLDLDGFWSDEMPGAHDNFGSARFEVIQVQGDQIIDHLAFSIANARHMDLRIVLGDPELPASPEIRSHLGAVNDILAWETGDVRARASDVFSFDNNRALSLLSQCPGEVFACFAAA